MGVRMVSTGTIIKMYLVENGISLAEVAEASNVSLRTVMRVINDETKLGIDVAIGINKLLPEIKSDFLLSYDSQYQLQKKYVEKDNYDVSIGKVISNYQMKKLYKDLANDEIALFEKAKQVFGLDNIINNNRVDTSELLYCFSLAKGERNNHLLWLKAAYEDCRASKDFCDYVYDETAFRNNFASLKSKTFTNDYHTTLYNMKSFCKKSGINFYYRPSIPGARVKAVAVKDKEGRVYILISDLFKCVENLWLAFIHECEHLENKDFDKIGYIKKDLISDLIDENYIDDKAIEYFIGSDYSLTDFNDAQSVVALAEKNQSPASIVAEIARFKTKTYSDLSLNKYIHYYKN